MPVTSIESNIITADIYRSVKSTGKDVLGYAGGWVDFTDEDVKRLFEDLEKVWEKWSIDA